MIDKEVLEEFWSELESSHKSLSQGEYKVYKTEFKFYDKEILLTVDYKHCRHLLIEIPNEIDIVEDKHSKGLSLLSHPLQETDGTRKNYIDLVCKYKEFNDMFSHLIVDILKEIEENPANINKSCLDIISKWRQFFKLLGGRILPLKVIVGLIGELYYLEKIFRRNGNLVEFWTGPDKSRHDFYYNNIALEIKTTSISKGRFFVIHGVKQLLKPVDGELFLCTLVLEKVPSNGITLNDLVDKIMGYTIDQSKFLSKLLQVGYDYSMKEEYEKDQFKIIEDESFIYYVDDLFPKIIPNTFLEGNLPNLVIDIEYKIDLSGKPPDPLNNEEIEKLLTKITE